MREWLVSYLTFSKKERTGILVLLGLILTIWLLPEYFRKPEKLDEKIMKRADSLRVAENIESEEQGHVRTFRLFYFDPNTITNRQWEELGIKSKTVSTIRNYLAKGGRFRKAEDLERIYGIGKKDVERLIPYVRIIGEQDAPYVNRKSFPKTTTAVKASYPSMERPVYKRKVLIVDVNSGDSAAFEALPGIGSRLATRIIRFRDALGGFHSIDQLREVYGINDTVFNLIAASLTVSASTLRKVKINEWDIDSLDLHPYIQKHEARAIVKYRQQHGPFRDPADLAGLAMLNEDWIKRLLPYLQLE